MTRMNDSSSLLLQRHPRKASTSWCTKGWFFRVSLSLVGLTLVSYTLNPVISTVPTLLSNDGSSEKIGTSGSIDATKRQVSTVEQFDASSSTNQKRIVNRSRTAFPKQAQMGWDQVDSILSVLPENGNLLVWGLGNDSVFWNQVTTGRVVFLEDGSFDTNLLHGKRWFDHVTAQNPQLEAYAVDYSTTNTPNDWDRYSKHPDAWSTDLKLDSLPPFVLKTQWDVILVDAPLGLPGQGPGRYQSLYTTQLLARNSQLMSPTNAVVHIFVDDYERRVERDFSQLVYGRAPLEVLSRPARSDVPANEQAHFVWDNESDGSVVSLMDPKDWIVLVEVSDGYYDFFLNWLSFYDELDIALELRVIAEDDTVREKIGRDVGPTHPNMVVQRSHLQLDTKAFDFSTKDYRTMVSARPTHILSFLDRGVNVIYADIDSVWRSSPIPFLAAALYRKDILLQVEYDQCYWNNKLKPCYCTGFLVVQSNPRGIQLVRDWKAALEATPKLNQPIFNDILHKESTARHGPLPRWAFPNGDDYYKKFKPQQRQKTVVVHNNFMVGRDNKRDHFVQEGLWNVPVDAGEHASDAAQ